MKRLNAQERKALRQFGNELLLLRADSKRRLRNAMLALTQLDPHWLNWVEREIDPESMTLLEIMRLVEARDRAFLLKRYGFFRHGRIGDLIFSDWPFTDTGALSPG